MEPAVLIEIRSFITEGEQEVAAGVASRRQGVSSSRTRAQEESGIPKRGGVVYACGGPEAGSWERKGKLGSTGTLHLFSLPLTATHCTA